MFDFFFFFFVVICAVGLCSGGRVVQWVYAVDLCGGGFESVVVVWVSMWVPSVVAGFESVVVVWVLAGLLNRWWLWVVESVWAGLNR